jgi:hypothetical protein
VAGRLWRPVAVVLYPFALIAVRWIRWRAEAGSARAVSFHAYLLGRRPGRGEEAEYWSRRAAEAGQTDALHDLGVECKETGRVEEAERWYRGRPPPAVRTA